MGISVHVLSEVDFIAQRAAEGQKQQNNQILSLEDGLLFSPKVKIKSKTAG